MTDNPFLRVAREYGVADEGSADVVNLPEWSDDVPSSDTDDAATSVSTSARPSQATQLVALAEARYRLGLSDRGEAFGVAHGGPNVARMLRGDRDSLRAELAAAYATEHGRAPSSQALADALLVLEGRAQRCDREPVALRVARHGRAVVLDLGGPDGESVVVDRDGWTVTASPVLFRRTALTDPLPVPERGGDLDQLWRLLNVAEKDRPLVAAWLVMALLPDRPCPVLALLGEQGSAKTSAGKALAALVDSADALRAPPRDLEGWIVAADSSRVVGLDNLSAVREWLSDAVCRAVTGEALVRRKLYTDSGVSRVAFRRPVVITAIDPGALRGDLADRLLVVELGRIADDRRLLDAELVARWESAHAQVLGALLDLVSGVLAELPSVRLDRLPRMADYARVLAAVDRVLGTAGLDRYLGQRSRVAAEVIDSDPVAAAILAHVTRLGRWSGTAGELLRAITPSDPAKEWPSNATAMRENRRTARRARGPARRTRPRRPAEAERMSRQKRLAQLERDLSVDDGERPVTWEPLPSPEIHERMAEATRDYLARMAELQAEADRDEHCPSCAEHHANHARHA